MTFPAPNADGPTLIPFTCTLVIVMKRLLLTPLALVALVCATIASAQTPTTSNVYILPMAGGMDQYLAGRLARERVLPVVTDPKTAGVVMTDRLGEAFEARLNQLVPPPAAESVDEKDDLKASAKENAVHPAFQSSARRGTFFLVDAKTRQVVWSGYFRPLKNPNPDSLDKQAAEIAKNLKTTFGR